MFSRVLAAAAKSAPATASPATTVARRTNATTTEHDLVVIGGGPGGYVAAIRAAQLGLKTACVEKRGALGGTCLNVGCIPSKALLNASHKYEEAGHDFAAMGIKVGSLSVDLAQMMKAKEKAVKGLTGGIELLFRKNKVDYVKGHGTVVGANAVQVGEQRLNAKNILIATGSDVMPLKGVDIDEKQIVSSTGALSLEAIPKRMLIIGGGVIGLELGSVWRRLGTEVTVVEFTDRIAAGADHEVADEFMKLLAKQKMVFRMRSKVTGAQKTASGAVAVTVEPAAAGAGAKEVLETDVVLVSVGRRPYTDKLGLESVGVQLDARGRIPVDHDFKTSVPSIRAIGDVIAGPMLAHKAEEEGIAAVEHIARGAGHVNYQAIPSVVYTHPEVAWVGSTEQELKEKKIAYRVGKFPFIGNSRARTNDDAAGFVKFLADPATDKVLGVHIIGPNAGELIAEAGLAIEYGASSEDIARTCHAHPTLSEAVKEAAMATYFKPIHI